MAACWPAVVPRSNRENPSLELSKGCLWQPLLWGALPVAASCHTVCARVLAHDMQRSQELTLPPERGMALRSGSVSLAHPGAPEVPVQLCPAHPGALEVPIQLCQSVTYSILLPPETEPASREWPRPGAATLLF